MKTYQDKLNPDLIGDINFPKQNAFVNDKSRFVAALCTRRAGKTNALALRFIRTMKKYPGSMSRYIALTRDSARDIMWPILQEINDRFNLNAKFTESKLLMELPNGAKLKLFGADMQNFIRRLKGVKSPAVALDEAQDFGVHIETLINDVLTPTIVDYKDSWIAVTGTPGPIPRGFFYDVTHGNITDYSLHKWSLYENPYLPDANAFVDQLKRSKKWDDTNPTYLREYKGQWVLDLRSLLLCYNEKINDYDKLPVLAANIRWNYVLGIDIGFNDSDALAIIGWHDYSKEIYLIEEIIQPKRDITDLMQVTKHLLSKYDACKVVIDTGGLGKKIAEELIRRHQIPLQAADKVRKMENAALLNDYLRLGKFRAKKDSRFAQDTTQVQIDHDKSTPDKIIIKKGFHSDIIDAVLYAFKESPAYAYEKEIERPKYGTPEWYNQEVSDMEQAAIDHFEDLENSKLM